MKLNETFLPPLVLLDIFIFLFEFDKIFNIHNITKARQDI